MTAAIGHATLRLLRWQIGEFTLEGLAPGHWLALGDGERQRVFSARRPSS
jgi:23S rRNA pseudouridine2457 synthase